MKEGKRRKDNEGTKERGKKGMSMKEEQCRKYNDGRKVKEEETEGQ